ncbi:3-hydroxyacyl-CoA dehydrogenase family protein [Amycolatopsis thermoflava]|uniref:3-hydroxybutyryl-CoA dehydrogenase n=1 Tax=Amycolatopsis thermoflava TaxID=84480 RepID=A0A3N2G674_9PSEU|nr:3-hydroxyacyl-CoA dehydrogenase family protein [Amycolatopsis thermoflava]ROS32142.1 3-hydroxybutyryl-CoA dehydrogenase [Amycolatopsis thermoflava]
MAEPVKTVGVLGGGTMGIGIAYVFAAAGCETTLIEPSTHQATRVTRTLAEQASRARDKGRLDAGTAASVADRVHVLRSVDELPRGLDLIVEAVPERAGLKRSVLLAAQARKPGLLASNTSGLSIDELAGDLDDPGRFLGLHFFNPVWSMPLLEVVRGSATLPDAVELAVAIAEQIGKQTIVVRDKPGFATSRLGVAIGLEAIRMLEDGVASAADIDRAMELGYRHPMGPLRLTDLVGLDVRLDIARHLARSYGPRFEPPRLLVEKVAAGETGKKAGRGFYEWVP